MSIKVPISSFLSELRAAYQRKDGYIMGATGQEPKKWATDSYWFTQYNAKKDQKAKALYWRENAARVWDCQGLPEGIYKDFTGKDVNTKARYNYSSWCNPKGTGMIPKEMRVPGAAVFWGESADTIVHVAFLDAPVDPEKPEGDWFMIEARGVLYGVVRTRLLSRSPAFWGLMTKYFDYGNDAAEIVLSRGMMDSEAVKQMQKDLIALGYSLGIYGADGDFGEATEKAIKAFQTDHALTVTGTYNKETREKAAALLKVPAVSPEEADTVTVKPGTWNIRTGPGTGYPTAEVVKGGDKLTPIELGTWQPILKNVQILYISKNALEDE